jgi:hypothetical protein
MSSYNKSSYFYDSSPIIGTSNQLTWAGGDVYCKDVNGVDVLVACNGTRLTTMQIAILNRICTLENVTDMTRINLPWVLYQAWTGTSDADKTILNYIQFLLDNACQQKAVVDDLSSTAYTSATTLDLIYCCCTPGDGCNTHVNVTISEHLENILTCLCELKTEVATTYATILELNKTNTALLNLCNRVGKIETGIAAWNVKNITLAPAPNTISLANNSNPC